ncbi:hypothetical protein [Gluconobacter morbifer]|uniref:Alginate lyase 2 domain-containing protein n=1 Tax=Gluconobacter morbifer G707 TaxID=1088869 RepID=G6XGS6_9PROT|nr:hypothetical protein [Gluconobacter morbifer]EHH69384.1 hypothetical protein GMO_06910 [Gluconobacter morbifer G707]
MPFPIRFLFAALLALTTILPAQALDLSQRPETGNFTLQEPAARLKLRLVPSTTLIQGYHSSFYQQNPGTGAITLQTDGLQPAIRGQIAPETLLRENTAWYFQETPGVMQASLHIDHFPRNGQITIGRIASKTGSVADLRATANQVEAVVHTDTGVKTAVVGTVYPEGRVSYRFETRPDGLLRVTVNGTKSTFLLPSAATAPPFWFEAVAGETGWHMPSHNDMGRVTFTSLQVQHFVRK